MYDLKQRIDELHPTLGTFKGTPVINLLSFLATFIDELNVIRASEETAMRLNTYYLDDDALDVHGGKLSKVPDDYEEELYE